MERRVSKLYYKFRLLNYPFSCGCGGMRNKSRKNQDQVITFCGHVKPTQKMIARSTTAFDMSSLKNKQAYVINE